MKVLVARAMTTLEMIWVHAIVERVTALEIKGRKVVSEQTKAVAISTISVNRPVNPELKGINPITPRARTRAQIKKTISLGITCTRRAIRVCTAGNRKRLI
ncbi:hypothetical protein [Bifidobacterium sp. W8104]|uniref:hypothetical protein n=1 Tax=Bifidobacterium sp. W8104 TaxID=2751001 RepID=UPI001E43A8F5|nr:hypothetical protein [Bifidobacterium sp. W8104]